MSIYSQTHSYFYTRDLPVIDRTKGWRLHWWQAGNGPKRGLWNPSIWVGPFGGCMCRTQDPPIAWDPAALKPGIGLQWGGPERTMNHPRYRILPTLTPSSSFGWGNWKRLHAVRSCYYYYYYYIDCSWTRLNQRESVDTLWKEVFSWNISHKAHLALFFYSNYLSKSLAYIRKSIS